MNNFFWTWDWLDFAATALIIALSIIAYVVSGWAGLAGVLLTVLVSVVVTLLVAKRTG